MQEQRPSITLQISINDKGNRKGTRFLVAELKANSEALQLVDVLSQHGAIQTLSDHLKEALEREVNLYVKSGKEMVSKLASSKGSYRAVDSK